MKVASSCIHLCKTLECKYTPVVAADDAAFPTPAILALPAYSWSFCARSCTSCFASVRVAPCLESKKPQRLRGSKYGSRHSSDPPE